MLSCDDYVSCVLLQAHGPFIYVHWFGTVLSMQRQGYGGQVMKAVGLLSSHFFWGFHRLAMYTILIMYNHAQPHMFPGGMSKEDAKMAWACFGRLSSCLAAVAVHKQAVDGHKFKHCLVQRALHKCHKFLKC